MKNIQDILNQLELESHISLNDIPEIDLYMDQVIQLFENKFNGTKRNEEEKVLTKTMVNNYAKGKLFFPIKNKKYSKEHLILISLIYQLKGVLSINDIKELLEGLNRKVVEEEFRLDDFYNSVLTVNTKNVENFYEEIKEHIKDVKEEMQALEDRDQSYLEQVLLIASLVQMSNVYRRTAEKLVDEIIGEKEGKDE
ncbi:DUF1836 domain-containing protein [Peribacillus asahii]|uniref:DUF1836 domain-containing protein n=1 Tax=Peribacillus asahii TaxID=228899 RepID=A0A398AWK7_9BACI|nr:DUF1836 domain-containing protein [Peribacillus asahii]RID81985.1 DUF1836 domain-containing protein [Peribacillus asahii]